MLVRLLTALVLIPLAVVLVFFHNDKPFAVAIGIASIIAAHEFYRGSARIGARPIRWAGLLSVAVFVISARTFKASTIGAVFPAGLSLLLILCFCAEFIRKRRAPMINIGVTVFGAIYVGWLISHMVVLRLHPGSIEIGKYSFAAGSWLVMMTFLCTWACDTGAFFVGRSCGKTRLARNLSPNKTVEGAFGGLGGSILLALIVGYVIKLPLGHALAMGSLIGVLSQIGDLSESAIKRELGIKDFGNIIPGHGGVLDRFDSLLFSAPAAYYYAQLFLHNWPK